MVIAKGAFGEAPITAKPGASAVTRSPWLIQTSSRPVWNRPVKSGSWVSVGLTQARPNSAWWPASTLPPSWAIIACWP